MLDLFRPGAFESSLDPATWSKADSAIDPRSPPDQPNGHAACPGRPARRSQHPMSGFFRPNARGFLPLSARFVEAGLQDPARLLRNPAPGVQGALYVPPKKRRASVSSIQAWYRLPGPAARQDGGPPRPGAVHPVCRGGRLRRDRALAKPGHADCLAHLLHPGPGGATLIAITFNFFVNNILTYRDKRLKGLRLVVGGLPSPSSRFHAPSGQAALPGRRSNSPRLFAPSSATARRVRFAH